MSEFSTTATLDLVVEESNLRRLRDQIESGIGQTSVDVSAGGGPTRDFGARADGGVDQRQLRRERRGFRLEQERTEYLEEILEIMEGWDEGDGGGVGLGAFGGGALGSAAVGGGIGAGLTTLLGRTGGGLGSLAGMARGFGPLAALGFHAGGNILDELFGTDFHDRPEDEMALFDLPGFLANFGDPDMDPVSTARGAGQAQLHREGMDDLSASEIQARIDELEEFDASDFPFAGPAIAAHQEALLEAYEESLEELTPERETMAEVTGHERQLLAGTTAAEGTGPEITEVVDVGGIDIDVSDLDTIQTVLDEIERQLDGPMGRVFDDFDRFERRLETLERALS